VKRRALLAAPAAFVATSALAQEPPRVVWIAPATPAGEAPQLAALRAGFEESGLVDGRDLTFEAIYANGEYENFPQLTRQALARKPAILMVVTIASVRAAQQATGTVPILFVGTNDPVGAGLVDSLARPGGNTTGVATMADEAAPKLIDMMHAALPQARRIAIVFNPLNATNRPIFERQRTTAAALGIESVPVELSSPDVADGVLGSANAPRPDAVILVPDAMVHQVTPRIAALGLERRVPVLGPFRDGATAGALLSYGPSLPALLRRAGFYVRRILAGTAPRDLPVERPTVFELVVNLRTASTIGVKLPADIIAIANETIE
jgi:putative ABC transport system substrate-binding protein